MLKFSLIVESYFFNLLTWLAQAGAELPCKSF